MSLIRLGARVPADMILEAEQAGYDYIEGDLSQIAALDRRAFMTLYALVREAGIRVEVMNRMLPPQINITGRGVNASLINEYLDFSFERARMLGCDLCVFSSPASRQVPEGWPIDVAWRQMTNFLRIVERHASAYSLYVAIEPVCRDECNILNTLREASLLAAILKLDHISVAASVSQMARENESLSELTRMRELISHVHVSGGGDKYPRDEDKPLCESLFRTLYSMSYRSRVSIDATYDNFREEAAVSFRVLNAARNLT